MEEMVYGRRCAVFLEKGVDHEWFGMGDAYLWL